jgi:nitroreductase
MELKEAIDKRHSVREFEERQVPKEILTKLIEAASRAPSAANWQPWYFYVVSSKKIREKLAEELSNVLRVQKDEFKRLSPKLQEVSKKFYSNMGGCQDIIFVYTDKELDLYKRDSRIMSVSAAIENMMLSAVSYGLGTCWMGSFKVIKDKINKMLKIFEDKEFVAGILVGYPKRGYKPLVRDKKKLKDILKFV